ncbi:MAG: hypothetical protein OQK04_19860 [Kangiellaceae bacterium]|nr:hypothetical protein [Kangiellaceae bacterium]MCW9000977.1 hypothetical protein [Kangiellaceae bacterium]
MMQSYSGSCRCGENEFELQLPKALREYIPRRCDCDFCTKRNIEYISDPNGLLILSKSSLAKFKQQGSNQARFLECNKCEQVFAVIYNQNPNFFGAANYACLRSVESPHSSQTVSPKLLGAEDKASRWQELWCPIKII